MRNRPQILVFFASVFNAELDENRKSTSTLDNSVNLSIKKIVEKTEESNVTKFDVPNEHSRSSLYEFMNWEPAKIYFSRASSTSCGQGGTRLFIKH